MSNTSNPPAETASTTVVEAVSETEDVDMTDLPPLFDAIDPDALDTIVKDGGVTVSFQYSGYSVEVSGPTDVTVQRIE